MIDDGINSWFDEVKVGGEHKVQIAFCVINGQPLQFNFHLFFVSRSSTVGLAFPATPSGLALVTTPRWPGQRQTGSDVDK